jgi:glycosyltransferase involved in cell wall biosynthesis
VIPAFNAEQSLARCLDGALQQTYQPIQIIVVNDGSTDATRQVAARYGNKIHYIEQPNQGETAARNRGFQEAHGEFVTFIDHDDYWEPEFVEATVRFLQEHPDAVAVSVGHEHRSALAEGTKVRPAFLTQETPPIGQATIIERFFDFWFQHDHLCAGSAMLRGSLIDRAGGQRTDLVLSGDMEYWAYLATFGKWGFIPRILLHVDGTQVPRGNLFQKFHNRYERCDSVESWEERVTSRVCECDRDAFARVRGRIATWYTFAHVFVGKDQEAKRLAAKYRADLDGAFGRLWQLGLSAGWLSWKPLCLATRLRTRAQYYLADRRR